MKITAAREPGQLKPAAVTATGHANIGPWHGSKEERRVSRAAPVGQARRDVIQGWKQGMLARGAVVVVRTECDIGKPYRLRTYYSVPNTKLA